MLKRIAIIILTVITLFIILIALGQKYFNKQNNSKFDTTHSAVIKELKQLNNLETASFTVEKIIESKSDSENKLNQILFGDQLLFIANGQAVAGFNLSKLNDSDVVITNQQNLNLNLPKPQILYTRLDNQKSRVYNRQTGIFTKGNPELESQTRQIAENEIRKSACEGKILDQATDNAKKQLSLLFKAFEFKQVNINVPAATCI